MSHQSIARVKKQQEIRNTMKQQKFSLKKRWQSLGHAVRGLKILIQEEHNVRIHLFAAILVLSAGWVYKITALEWIALIFAIGFVITTEVLNTTIEKMADVIAPEKHPKIKIIKDLAAAAVLLSACTAFAIGLIVFLPKTGLI